MLILKEYIYRINKICYNIGDMYRKGGVLVKKNMKNKKTKLLCIVVICFILLLIVFLSPNNIVEKIGVVEQSEPKKMEGTYYILEDSEMCSYLSDIEYDKAQSSVQWGSITLDSNLETQYNNGLITLNIDGTKTYFLKGVSAHATSTMIYDISGYNYDYFSSYIGVDESRGKNGNGVVFSIYTKTGEEDWVLKQKSTVLKGDSNAMPITVDIKGADYLKLYCDNNGNNASDHAVYANAKLYKDGYVEKEPEKVEFIKTVAEYDDTLKAEYDEVLNAQYDNEAQKNQALQQKIQENELTLLQRNFVNNVGYDLLQAIVNQNEDYKTAVQWLMENVENLRLYVLGGEPDGGSYYNSIKELSRLYSTYKDDFDDDTETKNPWCEGLTKGDVYKKMAITLSLTHATKVGYWAQIDHPSNRSDSVNRYKIYKDLYDGGKFIVARTVEKNDAGEITSIKPILNDDGTPKQDHTPWFEALTVEEMRYVMNNITDDEELIWFNEYTQARIDPNPDQAEKYLQPHTYIAYVWPNFDNEIYHTKDNYEYFDKLFDGIFSKYKVTYSYQEEDTGKVYKAWMSMRNQWGTGAVCGGISKLGCHIRAAHGTPASVVGQPGHAAIIYYRKDKNGKGYWSLDNDVSGWAQTGKSEKMGTRMPLGWGSDSYVDGYAGTYMMLSQEAINDYEHYEESEKINMTAELYNGDLKKQEEIYREALKVQKINIDAWWGLINVYKADESRTDAEYYELAEELGNALMPFPLPMKNLLDQIQPEITEVEYSFKFTLLETKLLNDAKNLKDTDTDKVYQPSIARIVANYLLGQMDTSLATFSFDGKDAGKIILASRFDNNGVHWDYSLDGKNKWEEVTFEPDEPHKIQLSKSEIQSITAENDIYIHIYGTDYSDANVYKIDIEEQSILDNLYANDLENAVMGVDVNTEWRYSENDNWTSYRISSPDLSGDKKVQVRQAATGTKLASPASDEFEFTEDNQTETRRYIRISDLSIKGYPENENNEGYSSQSVDSKRPFYAPNAIDGNLYTMWHTDFRYNVIEQGKKPYITVELNTPRYVSALEFIQRKYKPDDPDYIKNATVYVSMNGTDWTEAGKISDCPMNTELRNITFDESVEAKYVKVELETYNMFASIAMLNLFEDTTKIDKTIPTAGIYYSTQEKTSSYVIARLVNPSTEITITNNYGNDTYVFEENDSFTFTFEDKNGNKGSATATVDWIDKDTPTVEVDYKIDEGRKLAILLDTISEDVYLLDKNDNKVNYIEVDENKKVSKISYLDSSGNVEKIAKLEENKGILEMTDITYINTTGKVPEVAAYVTILNTNKVDYLDQNGNSITLEDDEELTKEQKQAILGTLQQVPSNPLEYTFDESGEYEFKFLDKASNIAFKSIKADYLEDNKMMVSDINYDITRITNQNVKATINPYIIDIVDGARSADGMCVKTEAEVVNNNSSNEYTFDKNHEFEFQYKDPLDEDSADVKKHKAKVSWIDKEAPVATIEYSTKEATDGPVTVKLVDESEPILITNNNTSREYTFTKNGKFPFKIQDEAGNAAEIVAEVDWINEQQDNPDENITGDLDNDGEITPTDLLLIKRHLVAGEQQDWILTGDSFKAADINKDNQVTSTDLLLMKRLVLEQMDTQ